MPQTIQFEGATHTFPDDFSQDEIQGALSSYHPMVRGMEKLGGVPPVGSTAPHIPVEMTGEGQPDSFLTSPNGLIRSGIRRASRGVEAMAQPGMDAKLGGISEVGRGLATAATPAAIPLAVANPGIALRTVLAGSITGPAVEFGSQVAGVPEGTSHLMGDAASAAAGYGINTSKVGRVLGSPDVWEKAGNLVPLLKLGTRIREFGGAIGDAINPPLPSSPRVSPPPLQGSSLERMTPPAQPKVAPPPLQGSSIPPVVATPKGMPAPPLRGSSLPPVVPQPQPTPAPPLRGSSLPPVVPQPKGTPPPPLKWNMKPKESPIDVQPVPETKPVTVTEEMPPVEDPAHAKAYGKVWNLVNRGKDKDLSINLFKSLAKEKYGVTDPKKLGTEDLNDIYDELTGKK